jgi:hypothetical protein
MNYEMAIKMIDYTLRWEMIFELLAMERTEPFLEEMGVKLPNVAMVRTLAREFLEQRYQGGRDAEGDVALVEELFRKFSEAFGQESAQTLHKWGIEMYPFQSARNFLWRTLFWWLAGIGSTHIPASRPALDIEKVEVITRTIQQNFEDTDQLEQRIQEAERQSKSEWEKRIYESVNPGYSPMMDIQQAIYEHKMHRIWVVIKQLLNEEELQVLLAWAKQHASSLQVEPESLKLPA